MNKLTEADADMLVLKFAQALQQARSVSDSEHYDHHRWITEKIEREQAMRKFWQAMHEHAMKWGMISALSGAFYALWLGVKAWGHLGNP